ncbi:MAG: hypothetical protein WAZ12_05520 [Candidatus Absconditicoccaceae bacterium]
MSQTTYTNGVAVTFTRTASGNANAKRSTISPYAVSKKRYDTAIIEKKGGKIEIIQGIRATAIIAKAQVQDYQHTLRWPKKLGKRKAVEIAVLSDENGKLSIEEGESAKKIILGEIPNGFSVEFIPPRREKK